MDIEPAPEPTTTESFEPANSNHRQEPRINSTVGEPRPPAIVEPSELPTDNHQQADIPVSSEENETGDTADLKPPSPKPDENCVTSQEDGKPSTDSQSPQSSTAPVKSQANYYRPPLWGQLCPGDLGYRLEVIKSGQLLEQDTLRLSVPAADDDGCNGDKGAPVGGVVSYCLIGRQPDAYLLPATKRRGQSNTTTAGLCLALLHPSISRLHAVLQYGRPPPSAALGSDNTSSGWYLQDLASTHGTIVNKRRLPPGRFVRLRVGHTIRFGGSTRLHILEGTQDDVEPISSLSWTELKEARREQLTRPKTPPLPSDTTTSKSTGGGDVGTGCNWGMTADDPSSHQHPASSLTSGGSLSHESTYSSDPKKALAAYFDREGLNDPQYEFVDDSVPIGKHRCRIELPLSTGSIYAEVTVGGKKKDAAAACALEACRLLDQLGEFDPDKDKFDRTSGQRSAEYWRENDYLSSDDDDFVDRTGKVERKRLRRLHKFSADKQLVEQAEQRVAELDAAEEAVKAARQSNAAGSSLIDVLLRLESVGKEIVDLEQQIEAINKAYVPEGENPTEMDELEAYMNALKAGIPSRKERAALKQRLFALRQLEQRLFTRAGLPQLKYKFSTKASNATEEADENDKRKSQQRFDAAEAVRAAKRKAQQEALDSTTEGTSDSLGDDRASAPTSQQQRSRLDAIKRSLDIGSGLEQTKRAKSDRVADEDSQPFVAESDEEDEEEQDKVESRLEESSKSTKIVSSVDKDPRPISPFKSPMNEDKSLSYGSSSTGNESHSECRSRQDASTDRKPSSGAQEDDKKAIKVRIYGPQLPPRTTTNTSEIQVPSLSTNNNRQSGNSVDDDEDVDQQPQYIEWQPPSDQSGDGVTRLNAKYGY